MTKDYAKHQTSRPHKHNKSSVLKKFLVLLFIAILISSGWFYLKKWYEAQKNQPQFISSTEERADKVVKVTVKPAEVAEPAKTTNEPQFEFYTILPKEKVSVQNKNGPK
jgi:hypothetical protein